jgi:cell division protein FtsB
VRLASGQTLSAALVLAIGAVALSAVLGEHGVAHLLRLRSQRSDLREQAFRLLQEKGRLADAVARLRSDDLYLEQLARRQLGLVRPGETVFRFRDPD